MINRTQALSKSWSDDSPDRPDTEKWTDFLRLVQSARPTPALIGVVAGIALFTMAAMVDHEAHLRFMVATMTMLVAVYIWPAIVESRIKPGLLIALTILILSPFALQHPFWLLVGFGLHATWNLYLAISMHPRTFYHRRFYQFMLALNLVFMVLTGGILL